MPKYPLTSFQLPLDASVASLLDINGATSLTLVPVTGAVNYLGIRNSTAGTAVRISALGSDSNIGIRIDPKGTGIVTIGTHQIVNANDAISINANARVGVALEGAAIGSRRQLNFLTGSNISYTITDDPGNERVDIEISSTGGGGGLSQDGVLILMGWGGY